jgi:hypothetical protein
MKPRRLLMLLLPLALLAGAYGIWHLRGPGPGPAEEGAGEAFAAWTAARRWRCCSMPS